MQVGTQPVNIRIQDKIKSVPLLSLETAQLQHIVFDLVLKVDDDVAIGFQRGLQVLPVNAFEISLNGLP